MTNHITPFLNELKIHENSLSMTYCIYLHWEYNHDHVNIHGQRQIGGTGWGNKEHLRDRSLTLTGGGSEDFDFSIAKKSVPPLNFLRSFSHPPTKAAKN